MKQLGQYIYFIWTECSVKYVAKTHVSHYAFIST